jgi:hypothetical protein
MPLDWIGWVATAAFASSYFFRDTKGLRSVQAASALLWVFYGALIHAWPVVVSNAVVAGVAAWTSWFRRPA